MKPKLLLFAVLALVAVKKTIAQSADEKAVKQTAKAETEAALKGDTAAWKAFFIQDEKTSITYTGNGYNNNFIGWQNISSMLIPYLQNNPGSGKYWFTDTNFIINQSGDVAAVQYDQLFFDNKKNDTSSISREYRTMVKVNNDWKIVSLLAVNKNSYTSGDSGYIENNLNGTGYQLLGAKKYKDAIEVFKLNVKLFPKSWNVYDSLGEAYADDGNTDNAIKKYEMSLKINPKNDNGSQWLEKLKKK
jgi:tetratricopeptide (TPR) repeat protein